MTAKEASALADKRRPEVIEVEFKQYLERIKYAASSGKKFTEFYSTSQEVMDKLVELGYKFESIDGGRTIIVW